MPKKPLIEFRPEGFYCARAKIYIDPWKPVKKAVITHAHADHARKGHQHYLAHHQSRQILKQRLGEDISLETVSYGQAVDRNGVRISLHPAGHIPGSAQIRLEHKGEVWVISGDYKLEDDGLSVPFEPVQCHTFITESTFGLPVYQWTDQKEVFDSINAWWRKNQQEGKTSVISAYALGKAQRLLKGLDLSIGKIYVHGAVWTVNEALQQDNIPLPEVTRVSKEIPKKDYQGGIIICPPSALGTTWMRKFSPYRTAAASGWMTIRGAKRRRALDRGFVLSDHADWIGLNQAVKATGAETVFVTHGYSAVFSKWLTEKGLKAQEVKTQFEGDEANE